MVFFPHLYLCHSTFIGLMMVLDNRTETSQIKFIHKAVITFLSKVVLLLLNLDQKLQFRKLEAITKKFSKLEADINVHHNQKIYGQIRNKECYMVVKLTIKLLIQFNSNLATSTARK